VVGSWELGVFSCERKPQCCDYVNPSPTAPEQWHTRTRRKVLPLSGTKAQGLQPLGLDLTRKLNTEPMPTKSLTTSGRERRLLAPYAMHSADSTGRVHPESPHPYRGPYQRDRDRIIHSSAYRRLAHKTQVFTGEMGDYHRSRLTHTLEVASIARTIGRALGLNEDLIESLALLHDVGHPPFGHAGEEVLDECLRDHGGFNHNRQALRLVEVLETRYPDFPGLNLTSEVLSGQRLRAERSESKRHASSDSTKKFQGQPLLEVQVVDAADSIAYNSHDVDDAFELGLLDLGQLLEVPLWHSAAQRVQQRFSALNDDQLCRAVVHQLIETLVSDLLSTTQQQLAESGIDRVQAVREHPGVLASPSTELAEQMHELGQFLFSHVYRHPAVLAKRSEATSALQEMFERLVSHTEQLPDSIRAQASRDGVPRAIGDYLSSMTDRFALDELRRLHDRAD